MSRAIYICVRHMSRAMLSMAGSGQLASAIAAISVLPVCPPSLAQTPSPLHVRAQITAQTTIATTNCCSLSYHVPITVLQHVCMRKFCVFFLLISVTLGRPHISYMMMVCANVCNSWCYCYCYCYCMGRC